MNTFKEIFNNPIYDQINNMVRWNGLSRIKDETVGHHTHIVTFFSRVIFKDLFSNSNLVSSKKNYYLAELLTYSIFHDFDEAFTGDILHNFKHNEINGENIKKEIDEYLNNIQLKNFNSGNPFHELMTDYVFDKQIAKFNKDIVKLADWLSMLFYLKKEMMLGNQNVKNQFDYCLNKTIQQTWNLEASLKEMFNATEGINYTILVNIRKTNFYENE